MSGDGKAAGHVKRLSRNEKEEVTARLRAAAKSRQLSHQSQSRKTRRGAFRRVEDAPAEQQQPQQADPAPDESARYVLPAESKSSRRKVPLLPPAPDLASLSSQELARTTEDFCRDHKLALYNGDTRAITHTGMDGKKINVKASHEALFLRHLAKDLNAGHTNYYCEILTPDAFAFYVDLDIYVLQRESVPGGTARAYAQVCQEAVSLFVPLEDDEGYPLLGFGAAEQQDAKSKCWKYGVHLVWPSLVVNVTWALYLARMILALLEYRLPEPAEGCSPYSQQLDMGVYDPNGKGGLRLPGCQKVERCKCSRGTRKKSKKPADQDSCTRCNEDGRIVLGRPHSLLFAMDEDGLVDSAATATVANDNLLALHYGHLRRPDGTPRRALALPDNAIHPQVQLAAFQRAPLRRNAVLARSELEETEQLVRERAEAVAAAAPGAADGKSEPLAGEKKSKATRGEVRVEKGTRLFAMVEREIRDFHPEYRRVTLFSLFTDKSRSQYSAWVDGLGSTFCINRDGNHVSSGAVAHFVINNQGDMVQRCTNRSKKCRSYRLACENFASPAKRLSNHLIRALFYNESKELRSLEDFLEAQEMERKLDAQLRRRQASLAAAAQQPAPLSTGSIQWSAQLFLQADKYIRERCGTRPV